MWRSRAVAGSFTHYVEAHAGSVGWFGVCGGCVARVVGWCCGGVRRRSRGPLLHRPGSMVRRWRRDRSRRGLLRARPVCHPRRNGGLAVEHGGPTVRGGAPVHRRGVGVATSARGVAGRGGDHDGHDPDDVLTRRRADTRTVRRVLVAAGR